MQYNAFARSLKSNVVKSSVQSVYVDIYVYASPKSTQVQETAALYAENSVLDSPSVFGMSIHIRTRHPNQLNPRPPPYLFPGGPPFASFTTFGFAYTPFVAKWIYSAMSPSADMPSSTSTSVVRRAGSACRTFVAASVKWRNLKASGPENAWPILNEVAR